MHQPPGQLALFTFEPTRNDSVTIPRRWQKTYKCWRGEFEVIRSCFVGKQKHMHFDFSIEIYDPDGGCETVVEITAPLPSEAEALFRHTVDKLADTIANIPSLSVTESLVLAVTSNIDSVTFPEVSRDTKDSVTFKDNPVTESLVLDATKDSVTFKDNLVTESLVLDATKDSVTAINIYEAKGTARGNRKYFRYSYKEVGKVKHLHIGGGNIHSSVAQSRMELVKDALAQGQSPSQIKQLIRSFRT